LHGGTGLELTRYPVAATENGTATRHLSRARQARRPIGAQPLHQARTQARLMEH